MFYANVLVLIFELSAVMIKFELVKGLKHLRSRIYQKNNNIRCTAVPSADVNRPLLLMEDCVSSGPRRGTRPRCPGRRRDEPSSSSSGQAAAVWEDFMWNHRDAGKQIRPTWAPPDPPLFCPSPPTNPEYENYHFLDDPNGWCSPRFRCWIGKKKKRKKRDAAVALEEMGK